MLQRTANIVAISLMSIALGVGVTLVLNAEQRGSATGRLIAQTSSASSQFSSATIPSSQFSSAGTSSQFSSSQFSSQFSSLVASSFSSIDLSSNSSQSSFSTSFSQISFSSFSFSRISFSSESSASSNESSSSRGEFGGTFGDDTDGGGDGGEFGGLIGIGGEGGGFIGGGGTFGGSTGGSTGDDIDLRSGEAATKEDCVRHRFKRTCIPLIQPLGPNNIVIVKPLVGTFIDYFNDAVPLLMTIAVGFCVLWILFGSYLVMVSGSDGGKRSRGKEIITWALLGLILVNFAGFFLRTLNSIFFF